MKTIVLICFWISLSTVATNHASAEELPDSYNVALKRGSFVDTPGRVDTGERVSEAAQRLIEKARIATIESNYVPDRLVHGATASMTNFDKILKVYTRVGRGFSARLSPAAVESLAKDPIVEFIEPNVYIELYEINRNDSETPLKF